MGAGAEPEAREIEPITGPVRADVHLPGSKSLTNRALVCAALAAGRSRLHGVLLADDTEAMIASLGRLGVDLAFRGSDLLEVAGCGGVLPAAAAGVRLDARLSGTTARFLLPVLGAGPGPTALDGAPGLRARPMGGGLDALRQLGVEVVEEGEPGHLPVVVSGCGGGGARPVGPGRVRVPGDVSSQFLSGLLLAGPAWPGGLEVEVEGGLVSRPYVAMTAAVMGSFGVEPRPTGGGGDDPVGRWWVPPGPYRAATYRIEPDASAASYFFAAAAILGGRVTVPGLGAGSLQGDLGFVDVLAAMGCHVEQGPAATTVEGTGVLRGVDVDLSDLSDTAQTLAAVAVFASSPTRVRGVGFIRHKETDRVGNVVRELRRCGIEAEEEPDGFVVRPGWPRPATVLTYDDHRMAMSFALLGLRAPGVAVADPGCVAKTFPGYWEALDQLRHP